MFATGPGIRMIRIKKNGHIGQHEHVTAAIYHILNHICALVETNYIILNVYCHPKRYDRNFMTLLVDVYQRVSFGRFLPVPVARLRLFIKGCCGFLAEVGRKVMEGGR
jgi:hypothetical protein